MDRVDTSRWNLFTSSPRWPIGIAAAVMACGPVLGSEDSDTDDPSATSSPTDPSDPSNPSDPTIDPTQGECVSDDQCPSAYECINNFCQYDDDCYCGSCGVAPPPGSEVRCSPGYECYGDYDCDEGFVCEYNYCQPAPSECATIPSSGTSIELQFASPSDLPVAALAFADVSSAPGIELLVARGTTIEIISAAGSVVALQTPTDVLTFAAADVDGDLAIDVVTAEDGDAAQLRLWHGSDGAFAASEFMQPMNGARSLAIGDREGDLGPDVYAHVGRDIVVFPTTGGMPLGPSALLIDELVDVMALADISSDGVSEILFGEGDGYWMYREQQSNEPEPLGSWFAAQIDTLVVADFSGDGEHDLAGFSAGGGLVTQVGEIPLAGATATTLSFGYTAAAAGDIDGDGHDDLVILEPEVGNVLVRYGTVPAGFKAPGEPYRCDTRYAIDAVGHRIAVGDIDGDGLAELAVADGARVVLVRF